MLAIIEARLLWQTSRAVDLMYTVRLHALKGPPDHGNPGQDRKYNRRVYLLYDGIHYDPLALTFDVHLPKEADVKVFATDDPIAERMALAVATTERSVREILFLGSLD